MQKSHFVSKVEKVPFVVFPYCHPVRGHCPVNLVHFLFYLLYFRLLSFFQTASVEETVAVDLEEVDQGEVVASEEEAEAGEDLVAAEVTVRKILTKNIKIYNA